MRQEGQKHSDSAGARGSRMDGEAKFSPRISLANQVLIGLLLGLAAGIFFGEMAAFLEVVGRAFVMLLQITVIPYVAVSLVVGLGHLSFAQIKELALKGGAILLMLWILGIATTSI